MSSSRFAAVVLVVLAVAALVAACGPGGGGTSGGGGNALNITVTGSEFKYDPNVINATAGQTINLTFKNAGTVQHTFVLKDANVNLKADPGQSVTATFTAPAAGTYQFECDIPGHSAAGMTGQLIVK